MRFILFIIIISVCLFSCNKQDKPYLTLNETESSFINFKPGSYWIMKDSITGREDSFVVFYNQVKKYEISDYYYDRRYVTISEYYQGAELCQYQINHYKGTQVFFYFRILPSRYYSFYNYITEANELNFQSMNIAGKEYYNTFTAKSPGSDDSIINLVDTLGATVKPQIGLLRIYTNIDTYKHTWLINKYNVSQ